MFGLSYQCLFASIIYFLATHIRVDAAAVKHLEPQRFNMEPGKEDEPHWELVLDNAPAPAPAEHRKQQPEDDPLNMPQQEDEVAPYDKPMKYDEEDDDPTLSNELRDELRRQEASSNKRRRAQRQAAKENSEDVRDESFERITSSTPNEPDPVSQKWLAGGSGGMGGLKDLQEPLSGVVFNGIMSMIKGSATQPNAPDTPARPPSALIPWSVTGDTPPNAHSAHPISPAVLGTMGGTRPLAPDMPGRPSMLSHLPMVEETGPSLGGFSPWRATMQGLVNRISEFQDAHGPLGTARLATSGVPVPGQGSLGMGGHGMGGHGGRPRDDAKPASDFVSPVPSNIEKFFNKMGGVVQGGFKTLDVFKQGVGKPPLPYELTEVGFSAWPQPNWWNKPPEWLNSVPWWMEGYIEDRAAKGKLTADLERAPERAPSHHDRTPSHTSGHSSHSTRR